MNNDDAEKLKAMLQRHEAVRGFPYDDKTGKQIFKGTTIQGNITIGVGRNLFANPLSNAAIDLCLTEDIETATEELRKHLSVFDDLDSVRQAALIDFCFNLGWTRLSGFTKTIAALESKDFVKASEEMKSSAWANQVGNRAVELAEMIKTGEWK